MTKPARCLRTVILATVAAGVALTPGTAFAQLGKLKKAATDAAKDKAGAKTEAPSTAASADYVITADRLAAVMAVMDIVMERAAKEAAAKAVTADYNTRHKAFETCVEAQLKTLMGKAPTADGMRKNAAAGQQTATLMQRMVAAQQANKYREYIAMNDTMQIASLHSAMVMYSMESKCPPVYMSSALIDDAAQKMSHSNSQSGNTSNEIIVAPAQRGGMTMQQFGMVRERASVWALQQINNAPVGNDKYGIFTRSEQAVLDAQGTKLKKWAQIMKDSPSTWIGWGDIKSW